MILVAAVARANEKHFDVTLGLEYGLPVRLLQWFTTVVYSLIIGVFYPLFEAGKGRGRGYTIMCLRFLFLTIVQGTDLYEPIR